LNSVKGQLQKMQTDYDEQNQKVRYTLSLDGEGVVEMNPLLGQDIQVIFGGKINCVHCGAAVKKTYGDGACYLCSQRLACCDICMVRPELCHHAKGTCREEDFAQKHCFQPHVLYLARTDVIKIGITRFPSRIHRWMDQGAVEAKVMGLFENRRDVGLAEHKISEVVKDKANWRRMLKNEINRDSFESYIELVKDSLDEEQTKYLVDDGEQYSFQYPPIIP